MKDKGNHVINHHNSNNNANHAKPYKVVYQSLNGSMKVCFPSPRNMVLKHKLHKNLQPLLVQTLSLHKNLSSLL